MTERELVTTECEECGTELPTIPSLEDRRVWCEDCEDAMHASVRERIAEQTGRNPEEHKFNGEIRDLSEMTELDSDEFECPCGCTDE